MKHTHRPLRQSDRYGLPLSARPAAGAAYASGLDALLALQPGAERHFAAAVEADGGCALAHAALGLLRYRRGQAGGARESLACARRATHSGLTRRERQHVAAVGAVVAGQETQALGMMRAHLAEFPRDALLLREASAITGSGAPGSRAARLSLMEQVAPCYADDWWFAGDLAFEYAEAGRWQEGQRLAERALALNPHDANAAHSLAHALGEGGHHGAVVAFLEGWLPGYPAGAPEFSHLAWHLGMSEARRSHPERALRVYHQRLDPARVPGTRLRDAAGLLWQLQLMLDGHHRGGALPWKAVADLASGLVRSAVESGVIDGLDAVFAAMAFTAAGAAAEAERLVGALHRQAWQGSALTESVTLPLVRSVLAFGAGAYRSAERLMASAGTGGLYRLGASNGQAANVLATMHEARRRRPRCGPCRSVSSGGRRCASSTGRSLGTAAPGPKGWRRAEAGCHGLLVQARGQHVPHPRLTRVGLTPGAQPRGRARRTGIDK